MSEGFPAAAGPSPDSFTSPALVKTEPEEEARSFDQEVIVERVKSEPEQLLYADHEIKEEMVIGPTEVRRPVPQLCHRYSIAVLSAIKASSVEYENARMFGCRVLLRDAREELQCAECGEWSLTAAELQRHKRSHAGIGNDSILIQPEERQTDHCKGSIGLPALAQGKHNQCDKQLTSKSNLIRDLSTHNRVKAIICDKSITCDICGRTFKCKSQLVIHLTSHSKLKPYACDICDSTFTRKSNLARHLDVHTKMKPYACDICDSTFTRQSDLARHLDVHSKMKPHACDICESTFKWKSSLSRHLTSHSKMKPYACDICKSTFSQKSTLSSHLAIHSKMKPYACDICESTFSQKSNLARHLAMHSKIKPYACDICDSTFTQKSSLLRHLAIHSKMKPYACDICESTFKWKSNLARHLTSHSKMKPYACDICGSTFKLKIYLAKHLAIHSKKATCSLAK